MTDAFDTTLPDSVSADSPASVRRVRESLIRSGIRQRVPGNPHYTKPSHSDIYIQTPFPDIAAETYRCLCLLYHLNSKGL